MPDHSAERMRIKAVPSAWQPLIQQKITIESRWTDFIELGAYLAMLSGIALLSWGLILFAIQIVLSKSIELPEFYESRSFYFFALQFPYLLGWFLISTRDKKAADQDLRVRKSVRFLIVVALGCFFILANLEVTHPTRFNSRILNVDKRVWGMLSLLLDYSLLLIHVLQIDLLRAICQKIALPQMASRFRWLFFVISVPIAVLLLILMLISSDRSLISRFQINSLISENRQFSPQHWPLVRIVFKLFFSIWIISEVVYLVSFVSFCFQLRKQSGKVFRESAQKSNPLVQTLVDDQGKLKRDLICQNCEYNLRGLAPNGNCPECGEPVKSSIITPQAINGSQPWIRKIRLALLLLATANLLSLAARFSSTERIDDALSLITSLVISAVSLSVILLGTMLLCSKDIEHDRLNITSRWRWAAIVLYGSRLTLTVIEIMYTSVTFRNYMFIGFQQFRILQGLLEFASLVVLGLCIRKIFRRLPNQKLIIFVRYSAFYLAAAVLCGPVSYMFWMWLFSYLQQSRNFKITTAWGLSLETGWVVFMHLYKYGTLIFTTLFIATLLHARIIFRRSIT